MEIVTEYSVDSENEVLSEVLSESENESDQLNVEVVAPVDNQISKKRKHDNFKVDEKPAETDKLPGQLIEDEENDDGAFCPIVSCFNSFSLKRALLIYLGGGPTFFFILLWLKCDF